MTPKAPPRVIYHLSVLTRNGQPHPVVLEAADVIAWVHGYATASNDEHHLEAIDQHAPEDTRRVQALQIGDAQGWFRYLYPETVEAQA